MVSNKLPRSWYIKIDNFFFQRIHKSKSDPNIYIKKDEHGNVALISLYVDDLIITGSATSLIDEIKRSTIMKDLLSISPSPLFSP
jgi:hypothetical protein